MCKLCGFENHNSSIFCERCASYLKKTSYDLTVEDFVTQGDRNAFEILDDTKPIFNLLHSIIIKPRLRKIVDDLSNTSMSSKLYGRIDPLIIECGDTLTLDFLPEVRIGDLGQKNAFTTEIDSKAIIIIDQSLMNCLSDDELRSLLGHEMGHIKSHHLMYHSTAELFERGIEFSSSFLGMQVISLSLKLALKAWHRESESSADRASLIVSDSFDSVASMFAKLVGKTEVIKRSGTALETILEIISNHPIHQKRLNALREFADSTQYMRIKKKLNHRRIFEKAFVETCKFCGDSKQVEDIFCPNCRRSLA